MEYYSDYIKDLAKLISFKSIYADGEKNYPFGKETANALNCFLDIAKKMGFSTINYDNYAGEVFFGEGEEIGIIGHLDVVPAGEGWLTDPFTLTEKDNKLIGRGTEDDKGALLLCLYALYALKCEKIKFNRKIRIIAGCNEETGWKDLEYLNKVTVLPKYGFSPDGDFPLSYAEKGVYIVTFYLPTLKNFCSLEGGTVINAVPAVAKAISKTTPISSLLEKHYLKYDGTHVVSIGKTAHGSAPQNGKNAFKNLFMYMSDCGENLAELSEYLFNDKSKLGDLQTEQGAVTLSPNIISKTENGYALSADLRIPAPLSIEDVKPFLNKFGVSYDIIEKHPPLITDKNGWFNTALLSAYSSVTGSKSAPVALCGSTFARAFENGCSFGIFTPKECSGAHEANEYISVKHVKQSYQIYKQAILNLIK